MMQFRNKSELIAFVQTQTGVTMPNDAADVLNGKRGILHTEIARLHRSNLLSVFAKYGIRYESHIRDSYFVYVKG